MIKVLLLFAFVFCIGIVSKAQNTVPKPVQKFSADTLRAVIEDWRRELAAKHPGFYRYTSEQEFNAFIDSVKSTIQDSVTEQEAYLKVRPIVTRIRCLHTGVAFSRKYSDSINKVPNLFPFQALFEGGKAYVVKNYAASAAIAKGDELVSINGQSIPAIVSQLLPLIPADGYNETMKYRALYYQFPLWYRLIDPSEKFSVATKGKGGETTFNIYGSVYDSLVRDGFLREPKRAKQLAFTIDSGIARLTIHTFSNSDIKRSGQHFRNFIDDAFAQLRTRQIKNLIVDLRDNTGGSDANAVYFARQFFDRPFRYWDRIEVTEGIARQIKGTTKVFYREPEHRDSIWLWKKARHVRDFDFYEEQQPGKNPYRAKTFVLINGFCISSCADVAAVLSHHKKAVFIGQETGGGYGGNTSGMMPETRMAPFHFVITTPLQKYVNAVDLSKNFGRGTMPDHPVTVTIDDILKGLDKELQTALELIQNGAE